MRIDSSPQPFAALPRVRFSPVQAAPAAARAQEVGARAPAPMSSEFRTATNASIQDETWTMLQAARDLTFSGGRLERGERLGQTAWSGAQAGANRRADGAGAALLGAGQYRGMMSTPHGSRDAT